MKNTINIGGKIISLSKPIIMGILNVTPDSFYKDSRFNPNSEDFLKKAKEMVHEGVDVFDIGGYSTRPGAIEVPVNEELARILPALAQLKLSFPDIPVSIDTFRAKVAERALEEGADIINDVSGGDFDPAMFPLIIEKNCPYILMHLNGAQSDIHAQIPYHDFLPELMNKLFRKANYLRSKGVKDIVLDPGFGFSKSIDENYKLLKHLDTLNTDHFPLLVGMSRKSMIYRLLEISPEESLPYSLILHYHALFLGAAIIRVHDVKPYANLIRIKGRLQT